MVPLVVAALLTILVVVWRVWPLAVVAAVASLAATVAFRVWAVFPLQPWGVLEVPVLAVLVFATVRWAPARLALVAGALLTLAAGGVVLRSNAPFTPLEVVYAVGFWALPPLGAAVVAGYLRHQRTARTRDVDLARREQRLELAGDLHDYVAHDVSEMIAQAQAAALVADGDVRTALERIEVAGQRAMTSMDRMVHMLHADGPAPGLSELPELTERFAEASGVRVSLDLDPALAARIPRELTSTVHRVVVEALTNIRRHAPDTRQVAVAVTPVGESVRVSVVNDVSRPAADAGRGGLGLPGLAGRVGALSGTLRAGPLGDGWEVVATLPMTLPMTLPVHP
jgi:signal transduction histidine kinase